MVNTIPRGLDRSGAWYNAGGSTKICRKAKHVERRLRRVESVFHQLLMKRADGH